MGYGTVQVMMARVDYYYGLLSRSEMERMMVKFSPLYAAWYVRVVYSIGSETEGAHRRVMEAYGRSYYQAIKPSSDHWTPPFHPTADAVEHQSTLI